VGLAGTRGRTYEKGGGEGEGYERLGDGCCKVNDIYVAGRSIAI